MDNFYEVPLDWNNFAILQFLKRYFLSPCLEKPNYFVTKCTGAAKHKFLKDNILANICF